MIRHNRLFLLAAILVFSSALWGLLQDTAPKALALDNDFSNGITVDSTTDGSDTNLADATCDDGAGRCTLRAAIEEANDTPGAQTIKFNISGTADFVNGIHNGYTIRPSTELPAITDTTIIDGYTQSGASANTSVSPNPLNGMLLIEISGANAPSGSTGIRISNGDAVQIRGLVINSWSYEGVSVNGTNAIIAGNYIGTDYSGTVDLGNKANGVSGWGGIGNGATIGGTAAADRNIISGNGSTDYPETSGMGMGPDHNNWTVQGNYIGVAADGVTAIPNAQIGGAGNPSVDFVSGTLIGGSVVGAANVISGNNGIGIAPSGSSDVTIQGNYIGTDYSGTVAVPNLGGGISPSDSTNVVIGGNSTTMRNIVSANGADGIYLSSVVGFRIQGNHIGTGITGSEDFSNGQYGVFIEASTDGQVGGTAANEANIIANNTSGGVGLINNSQVSIIGNSIFANYGLGIDLDGDGLTPNDTQDIDTGANDKLNFPQYTSVDSTSTPGDTTVYYRLDAPAGDYRIEFFSNTTPHASGYGEGQTYLGYQDVSHPGGGNMYFSHTLTGVASVTNMSMTTTQRSAATLSGFGATSEYSSNTISQGIADLAIQKTLLNPGSVAVGATLTYHFTITSSNTSDPIDLAAFDGNTPGATNLLTDIMPPDITFADGVSDPNISCMSAGAGSAAMFGSAMANHLDHEVVLCMWTGANSILATGQSFSFDFNVTVQPNSDLVFDNYAILPPVPSNDPDLSALGAIYTAGGDVIDGLLASSMNNFSVSRYPLPPEPTSQPTQTNTNNSLLAKTGEALKSWYGIIGLIGSVSGFVFIIHKTRRAHYILSSK